MRVSLTLFEALALVGSTDRPRLGTWCWLLRGDGSGEAATAEWRRAKQRRRSQPQRSSERTTGRVQRRCFTTATTSSSHGLQQVFISGQVRSPGAFSVPSGATVLQAHHARRRSYRTRHQPRHPHPARQERSQERQARHGRQAWRHDHRQGQPLLGQEPHHGESLVPTHRHSADSWWHPTDYLRTLYKRRWVAIPAFLLVFVSGALDTIRAIPIYEARTQLLIERDTRRATSIDAALQDPSGRATTTMGSISTQYRIIQSRSMALRTVEGAGEAGQAGEGPDRRAASRSA